MNESINDINNLLSEGIYVKQFNFIKQTIQYNSYHGCDSCDQISKNIVLPNETKGKNIYSSLNINSRGDYSFRNKIDPHHHIGITPLLNLPIDMIKTFPVDYMHCALLGVVRKVVRVWLTGCYQTW